MGTALMVGRKREREREREREEKGSQRSKEMDQNFCYLHLLTHDLFCFVPVVYRGCADMKKWPRLDTGYVGCKYQTYQMWDQRPVLWCFCDFELCNTNVTFLK